MATMTLDGSSPRNRVDTSGWSDLHWTGETWARRESWPRIMGDTRTHDERSIPIGGLWLKEIVDPIVRHDSTGSA